MNTEAGATSSAASAEIMASTVFSVEALADRVLAHPFLRLTKFVKLSSATHLVAIRGCTSVAVR
jgi:hypothetical protein